LVENFPDEVFLPLPVAPNKKGVNPKLVLSAGPNPNWPNPKILLKLRSSSEVEKLGLEFLV
jgi:hypothetical protein